MHADTKKELSILLSVGGLLLLLLSILGWQSLFSAKQGVDFSGTAGDATSASSSLLSKDSLHFAHPNISEADLPVLTEIKSLKTQFDSEPSTSRKATHLSQISENYLKLGLLDKAGDFMAQAAELSETNKDSLYLRAANLYDDGKFYQAALRLYEQSLQLMPNNVDARIDFAICLLGTGKFEHGLAEMKKSLEIAPEHQIGNLNMGIIYMEIDKNLDALPYLEKAEFLNPNTPAGKKATELIQKIKSMKN